MCIPEAERQKGLVNIADDGTDRPSTVVQRNEEVPDWNQM